MNGSSDNIRVVIPLSIRRRNGRPKILPPQNVTDLQTRSQDPHILKAIGRAWAWRRKLESGEIGTIHEIANAENVSDRMVGKMMKLAFLSPDVLARLLLNRVQPSAALHYLLDVSSLPWATQSQHVFGLDPYQKNALRTARLNVP